MSFPRYEGYKDSGVEWLGQVPAHWEVLRNKAILQEVDDRSEAGDEELLTVSHLTGVTRRSEKTVNMTMAESLVGYKICRRFDLAINTMWGWMGALGVSWYDGIVSPSYNVYRFRASAPINPRYYDYLCRLPAHVTAIKANSTGVWESRLRIYPDTFLSMRVATPPLGEQDAIVSFLDHETAKIDALVGEQRRLIELLKEKRQAVISQAVTKGLDPNAPMKDSGVEWLGQVPEHWEVKALKHVCALLKDGTHLPPARVDSGVPLLSIRNIDDGRFGFKDDDSMISEESYRELCRSFTPQPDDVLLAIVGATLGKTALVPKDMARFHIQRSLAVFRTSRAVRPAWLNHFFQSAGFQRCLWQHVGYSAQPGIYLGALAQMRVPVPSIAEQIELLAHLGRTCSALDALVQTAEAAVELLKERRTALISAAVTGKIDVRGAVPATAEAA